MIRPILLGLLASLLGACASAPPSKPQNICAIFEEKSGWYKDAKKSEEKWGTGIPVMMATIYQESTFVADARPPRRYYLGFIPGSRPSDAYGYPQALSGTWRGYQKATDQGGADRDDFGDAIDFVGWYYQQSYSRNKIARNDAYRLYLTYHEGHGGYARGTYQSKAWLKKTATAVAQRSRQYEDQLKTCVKDLESSGFLGLF